MITRSDAPLILTSEGTRCGERLLAVEAPVAVEVNGIGYAVMMATPADLVLFARGFMLTERLADTPADVLDVDVAEVPLGWIARVTLAERCADRIGDRVRHRTSDTGCGLCGISGLEQVARPLPAPPPAPTAGREAVFRALGDLRAHQHLNAATGAVHGAAWCDHEGAIMAIYEDVGRHNALDKLIGSGLAGDGFLLVTSRVSFEMVDKALVARAPMLVGISAPTTMAVDHARANGLTLLALARADAVLVMHDPHARFA